MQKPPPNLKVALYGFDAVDFQLPNNSLRVGNNLELCFIPFDDKTNLESFDGVVVPQGIFETLSYSQGFHGTSTRVSVETDVMLERERQVKNLVGEGKWICFLVDELLDFVPAGYSERQITDTDLCKRMLMSIGVNRHKAQGALTGVVATQSEFQKYINAYGVAKTVFDLPVGDSSFQVLAKSGYHTTGFEWVRRMFFMPFHTTKKVGDDLSQLATILVPGILDYQQKRRVVIPEWLKQFRFDAEKGLESRLDALLKEEKQVQSELETWMGHKALLVTSGDLLREKVIMAFHQFFGFKVDPKDEGKEDAKLLTDDDSVLCMMEVKGTKEGVRRDYISQAANHRDQSGLDESTPALLIVNAQMDEPGLERRLAVKVAEDQVKYAVKFNVLVVRAVDLLMLMRQWEDRADRKEEFTKMLKSGGGWLQVDDHGWRIKV